jgi:predicted transcriptional regulator
VLSKVYEYDADVILGVLSDKYCRKILYTVIEKPKSAFEISAACDILLSTVYRKLRVLKDYKLVNTRCEISPEGKKRFLYQSKISSVSATVNKDLLDIQVIPNFEANRNLLFNNRCENAINGTPAFGN